MYSVNATKIPTEKHWDTVSLAWESHALKPGNKIGAIKFRNIFHILSCHIHRLNPVNSVSFNVQSCLLFANSFETNKATQHVATALRLKATCMPRFYQAFQNP